MKVTYKGIPRNLTLKLQEKLDVKFAKLSKLLDAPGGEKSAHVVLTQERHLHNAEITLQVRHHQLVGIGSDGDVLTSMSLALAKLEKQALKHSARERETARRKDPKLRDVAGDETDTVRVKPAKPARIAHNGKAAKASGASPRPRIFRVSVSDRKKPITLDEAVMLMEDGRTYLIYRDVERERVTILVRRQDGHFDLIES
jgi:putative sigma-54 modulation protein